MASPGLLSELQRRNVYRAAAFYAASAWLLVQVATQVLPFFGTANWLVRWIIVAAAIGFPFWLLFAWFYQWTPQGLQREQPAAPLPSEARQAHRNVDRWIIAMLAIAVVLLLTDKVFLRESADRVAAVTQKSIAVLPLVNSSGDPGNDYFSDGMSEEFISSLSRLRELKVIGRSSSFQFKGKNENSKTVGEKLGVFYLLEGSVRKSADRVRIAVALVKAGDGANVWSETYDRELKDVFALQSEIAGAVAKELKVALLGPDGRALELTTAATPSKQNVEAYNALLQGNFHFRSPSKAIGHYEEAIRLDPGYALAYAKMSLATRNSVDLTPSPEAKEELIKKARASAGRALELDPNLADAHSSHGVILQYDFDFAGAEAALRRAVELAPQHPGATSNLGYHMALLGRIKEAIELGRHAITLDPLRPTLYRNLGRYLVAIGLYDEAQAPFDKFLQFIQPAPVQFIIPELQILRGEAGAAVELGKQITHPWGRPYILAMAHFANGDRAEADVELKKLIEEHAHDAPFPIAVVYAQRKEPEKMFEWLERAVATNDKRLLELLLDPFLRAYKDDPRFIAFAQKIGVMPKTAPKP